MSFNNLPEFVRIKRKRNQDSLQALILELPKSKKAKNEQFVFKLQRTDSKIDPTERAGEIALPLLQESGEEKDKENTFILPKLDKKEDKLPEQFTEMLDSILNLDSSSNQDLDSLGPERKLKRKAHKGPLKSSVIPQSSGIELEYVYDVYYRDRAVQETWEVSKIGYIKFEEDANDLVNEDDNNSLLAVSDDEDSNAEDFYQNDYPEDEDAGNDNDGLEVEQQIEEEEEEEEPDVTDEELIVNEDLHTFDDLYDQHFGGNGPSKDFLQSLQQEFDDDEDDDDEADDADIESDTENYKRQNFFPGEEDDDLAKHRDKIFGRLEKMIERA